MTDQQFDARVAQLAAFATRNPGAYKLRVLLMALLGNAYLAAMLLVIVLLFAISLFSIVYLKALGIKLALVIGAFLWLILRALWVKIAAPEGTAVNRRDCPDLFAMIDQLRHSLHAPRFHHVLVTDEFNAGVAQVPRLGIFGWHRNYLLLGLPLMKALSVDQFKAVLAHEFGHLARGHGAFSNWIYRLRLRWARLVGILGAVDSAGSFLFKPFFNWYAPAFAAYSFPLARANEYEADATAARLTSASTAAAALTNVNVIGFYLGERYWPQIHRQADDHQQPAFAPFDHLAPSINTDLDPTAVAQWLERAMRQTTVSTDTHPALADRLRALDQAPASDPPAAGQAADRLLGGALLTITDAFDSRWKQQIMPSWLERYRNVQEGRNRLAELDTRSLEGELPLDEAFERARLTEGIGRNPDAALEQLQALAQRAPERAGIQFAVGQLLLSRDDDAGRAAIERAMALDENAIASGSEALRDYFARVGRTEEAERWHQSLVERATLEEAARRERGTIKANEKFEPHGLDDASIEALRTQLRSIEPAIRRAYLVKKRVLHLPQHVCYVLGFTITGTFRLHDAKKAALVGQTISQSLKFPGETVIFNVEGSNAAFAGKFKKIKTARLL